MTTLQRLESATNDPQCGGFLARFPSGAAKTVAWRHGAPITPTLDAAKQYSASLLQALLDDRLVDDADRTNWASVTAAVQRILLEWNERLVQHLRRPVDNSVH